MTAQPAPTVTPPALLDLWQVGDYLNMTDDAVRRLIRDGVIPTVKIGGRPKSRIRVRRTDLDALIEASLTPATTGPLAK
ncbi:helix-turn-helix domain-containing protein [Cellulomonas palmilytica]|uniref:helix-turn-helix domain-containing protein n=1 Tax=Cellulomonas palmilytica TaxID=2608402 RepID=UPI001F1D9FC2|nr:helix-turn-helix domain-containing protein [Cellulomonas palmilytica]UJP40816.1 helix-turn-helix domain-containing protein [Cellulomonas palmilytica]